MGDGRINVTLLNFNGKIVYTWTLLNVVVAVCCVSYRQNVSLPLFLQKSFDSYLIIHNLVLKSCDKKSKRGISLAFFVVEVTGLAPWADAHGKQRVSAVLSEVEPSDLRRKNFALPPLKSRITLEYKKSKRGISLAFFVVEVTGLEPTTFWSLTRRATKLRYTSITWTAIFIILKNKQNAKWF